MKLFNAFLFFVCVNFLVFQPTQSQAQSDSILDFSFDGNANDGSGNNNHATVNGPTLTSDKDGNASSAYQFDGVDDEIMIPDDPSLDVDYITLSAWIYVENYQNDSRIISREQDVAPLYVSSLLLTGEGESKPQFRLAINGSQQMHSSGTDIPLQNWTHVAATYDGTAMKIYINGTFDSQKTISGTIDNTNFPIYLSHSINYDRRFHGKIDEVKIFSRALSDTEIADLYGGPPSLTLEEPTNVSAVINNSQVDLTWTDNSDSEQGFIIERTNIYGGSAFTDSVSADITNYLDTNVLQGATYEYRVKAYNADIHSVYSNTSSIIIPGGSSDYAFYELEDNYTVIHDTEGDGSVGKFSNSINSNGKAVKLFDEGDIASTNISISEAGTYQLRFWVRSGGASGSTSLVPEGYIFSVIGMGEIPFVPNESTIEGPFDAYGTAYFGMMEAEIDFTTTGVKEIHIEAGKSWVAVDYLEVIKVNSSAPTPESPSNLTASLSGNGVQLDWQDNSDNEDGFIVERTDSNEDLLLDTVATNIISYIDQNVVAGETYDYKVKAFNQNGESDYSNTATISIPSIQFSDTTRYEIEDNYEVISDVGTIGTVGVSGNSINSNGKAVRLFDYGDEIAVTYDIPQAGTYQVRVWVRSGNVNGPSKYWPDGYLFSTPEFGAVTFIGNTESEEGPFSAYGTTYWGFMEAELTYSTTGTKSLHIESNKSYSVVDFVEVVSTNNVPDIPIGPLGLQASIDSLNHISLNWTDNSDNEEGFILERSTNGANFTVLDSLSSNLTNYEDSTVVQGDSYAYRVNAYNSAGNSPYSNESTISIPVVSNELVVDFDFSGNANDASGNNNSGTVNGATLTTDKDGNANSAYQFDGVDDEITISHNNTLDIDYVSFSSWIYVDAYKDDQRIISLETGTEEPWSSYSLLLSGQNESRLQLRIGVDSTRYIYESTNDIPLNTWTHVAATYDGDIAKLYINGQEDASHDAVDGVIWNKPNPLYIGGSQFYDRNFQGKIDEVKVYNKALSGAEVSDLYSGSPVTVPTTPSNLAASLNNGVVELSWTDNSDNEDGFIVEKMVDGSSFTILDTLASDTTNYVDSVLVQEPNYTYRIKAFNAAGHSNYSNEVIIENSSSTNDLILDLTFSGNSNDSSGNNNDGVVNGAILTSDRDGNASSAYQFDGVDDDIMIPDDPSLDVDYITMSSWIYLDSYTNDPRIISRERPTDPKYIYSLFLSGTGDKNPKFRLVVDSVLHEMTSTTEIPLNTWTHLAATYDGTTMRLFVDGELDLEEAVSGTIDDTDYPLYIGHSINYDRHFSGKIDDIRLYKRALTTVEVRNLYQLGSSVPQVPELSLELVDSDSVALSWNSVSNNPDGYIIERSVNGTPYSVLDSLASEDTLYYDTEVSAGAQYSYRIQSFNEFGASGYSNVESIVISENDELVLSMSFSGNANDASGNNIHGINNGALLTSDRYGNESNAFYFDGANDDVMIPDNALLDVDNITISTWINPESYQNDQRIISREQDVAPNYIYSLLLTGAEEKNPQFRLVVNGTQQLLTSSVEVPLHSWTHLAATYDGTNMKIYVNAELVDQKNIVGTIDESDFPIYIGHSLNYDRHFHGKIDDLKIYGVPLSASEISDLYQSESGGGLAHPTNLTATLTSNSNVLLNWEDNADDESGYFIERKIGEGAFELLDSVGTDIQTYIDENTISDQTYTYRIKAYSGNQISIFSNEIIISVPNSDLINIDSTRVLIGQLWNNIQGGDLSNLTSSSRFPSSPDSIYLLDVLKGPVDFADNYGQRIYGYITPSETGNYEFWVAADDQVNLYLSTDSEESNKQLIVSLTSWSSDEEWDKYPEQKSAPVSLEAGVSYYVELVHKEGIGGDHITVAWTGPNGSTQQVIGSEYLSTKPIFSQTDSIHPPTNLQAVLDSNNHISLSWIHESDHETGYVLERNENNAGFQYLDSLVANSTFYLDSLVGSGSTYQYRIYAHNESIASEFSDKVSVDIPEQTGQLVLDLPFEGNANDQSINGYTATVHGTSLTKDRFGNENNAFSFDGIDDYISYGDVLDIGKNDWTISSWVKIEVGSVVWPIINKYAAIEGPPNYKGWQFSINPKKNLVSSISDSMNSFGIGSNGNFLKKDMWHHIAAKYDRSGFLKLYLDNVIQDSVDISQLDSVEVKSAIDLKVGLLVNIQDREFYFKGTIDDLKIYNYLISDEVLQEEYTNGYTLPSSPALTGNLTELDTIKLSWENGNNPVIAYVVERSRNGGEFVSLDTLPSSITRYDDLYAYPDNNYFYRIKACNPVGENYSNEININIPFRPEIWLDATCGIIGSNWSIGNANSIDWESVYYSGSNSDNLESPGNNPDDQIVYQFEIKEEGEYKIWGRPTDEVIIHTIDYENFTNSFWIKVDQNPWENWDSVRYNLDSLFYWDDVHHINENGVEEERSYFLEEGWHTVTVEYKISDNKPNLQKWYISSNDNIPSGKGYKTEPCNIENPPATPNNLTASQLSENSIQLMWTDFAVNELGFVIEKAVLNNPFSVLDTLSYADSTVFIDYSVIPNETYVYRVKAFNENGESLWSNTDTIKVTELGQLVFDLPFNGNAIDQGPNAYEGDVIGPVLAMDRFGNANGAYHFDGEDDYINFGDVLDMGTSDMSISLWIKTNSNNQSGSLLSKINSGISNDQILYGWIYGINHDDSYRGVWGYISDSINYVSHQSYDSIILNENIWHHIVFTMDRDGFMSKYVDGKFIDSLDISIFDGINLDYTNDLMIGAWTDYSTYYYEGLMDDIKVYNGMILPNEINDLYNEGYSNISPPDGLNVVRNAHDTVKLEWSSNNPNLGYIIERKENQGEYIVLDSVNDNTYTFIDTEAIWYKPYSYRVKSFNPLGEAGYSEEVSINPYELSEIVLEAECGEIGSNWTSKSDPYTGSSIRFGSSNGKYVSFLDSLVVNNDTISLEKPEDQIFFTFEIKEQGEFKIRARFKFSDLSSPGHKGFWIKVDNGSWINWNHINLSSTPPWYWWDEIHYSIDESNEQEVIFSFEEGIHTLLMEVGDPNIVLDKIVIHKLNELDYHNQNAIGNNCEEENSLIAPPNNFIAYSISESAVHLEWEDPSNGRYDFEIHRDDDGDNSSDTLFVIQSGITHFLDSSLVAGNNFSYWIYSKSDINYSVSSDSVGVFHNGEGQVPDSIEYRALMTFYDSLGGPNWYVQTNWGDTSVSFNEWAGISTENGDVVNINLEWYNLSGKIPNNLTSLKSLRELSLLEVFSNNGFSFNLPDSTGKLVNLEKLELKSSSFGDSVKAFSFFDKIKGLSNLSYLSILAPDLYGPIPANVGDLSNLDTLIIHGTPQGASINGALPDEISNLSKLKYLYIYGTSITDLGEGIFNLSELESLHIRNNQKLDDTLPESIGNMQNLVQLDIHTSSLHGILPNSIGDLINIEEIKINNTNIEGKLPDSFSNLSNLKRLEVRGNKFNDFFTVESGNLQDLKYLDLSSNNFVGNIPDQIYNLENLERLYLDKNRLSGFTNLINNLNNLKSLYLKDNLITNLPSDLSGMDSLTDIHLSNNLFTAFPSSTSTIPRLYWLDISQNEIIGTFPEAISQSTNLVGVLLSDNKFYGTIDSIDIASDSLIWIEIQNNYFTTFPTFNSENKISTSNHRVYLQNNKLGFDAIENQLDSTGNYIYDNFSYSPQKPFGYPTRVGVSLGQDVTITCEVGGDNNVYQWQITREDSTWTDMPGANTNQLILSSVTLDDFGSYRCEVNNSLVTDLTIYTEPFIVTDDANIVYHAIASGDWNDPNIWSDIAGGGPVGKIPQPGDKVYISGYNITITEDTEVSDLVLSNESANTVVSVNSGKLTHYGSIKLEKSPESSYQCKIEVSGTGSLEVKELSEIPETERTE